MQHDVYDYTAHTVSKNTVLQKTYRLLGFSSFRQPQARHLPPMPVSIFTPPSVRAG